MSIHASRQSSGRLEGEITAVSCEVTGRTDRSLSTLNRTVHGIGDAIQNADAQTLYALPAADTCLPLSGHWRPEHVSPIRVQFSEDRTDGNQKTGGKDSWNRWVYKPGVSLMCIHYPC